MPPWLVELLLANNSKGYVDTLSTLVGGHPNYTQMAPQKRGKGMMMGKFGPDSLGNPLISLGLNAKNINQPYKNTNLGNYVIPHEFGHMAADGTKNIRLAERLTDIFPDAPTSENFADDFQLSTEFLRSHKIDTRKLSDNVKKIIGVLLQEEIYKDHPLNKPMIKAANAILDAKESKSRLAKKSKP